MMMFSHNSSAIHSSGHDGRSTMRIHFHSGHTYEANDVTPEEHDAFCRAESQGKHWHSKLKSPAHVWTKVAE